MQRPAEVVNPGRNRAGVDGGRDVLDRDEGRAARDPDASASSASALRRGRGATGLLFGALVVCALVLAAIWLATRDDGADGARGGGAEAVGAAGHAPREVHDPVLESEAAQPTHSLPPSTSNPRPSFAGRGTVRGEVVTTHGVRMPEQWTLVLEPSAVLTGREHATTKRVAFEHGETSFRVDDLPLAGYRVRAEAFGLNDMGTDVLLVTSSPDQFVTLAFKPGGFIDGLVHFEDDAPAEGVELTLETAVSHARRRVESDVNGAYVFDDVVDGDYVLFVGPPDAPLVKPVQITFRAPSLRAPLQTLPPLATARLRVVDEEQRVIAGAHVIGSSASGGVCDGTTDELGVLLLRHVPAGAWTVEARSGTLSSGVVAVELALGPVQDIDLVLHP